MELWPRATRRRVGRVTGARRRARRPRGPVFAARPGDRHVGVLPRDSVVGRRPCPPAPRCRHGRRPPLLRSSAETGVVAPGRFAEAIIAGFLSLCQRLCPLSRLSPVSPSLRSRLTSTAYDSRAIRQPQLKVPWQKCLSEGALWALANCEACDSKTREWRRIDISATATPHQKKVGSTRRRQPASRTAHTRRQRNSTDRRLWHSLSVPAAPVRGTNHDV